MAKTHLSDILHAVKQRDAQEPVIEIEEKTVQLVVFQLDERFYAFYGHSIKEILPVEDICYIPGMPSYLPGVIHVRGEIESVLDLRTILQLSNIPITKRHRILIGKSGHIRSGILVDSVEDVLDMPEELISEPVSALNSSCAAYIIGETVYKEQELILFDLDQVFKNLLTLNSSS